MIAIVFVLNLLLLCLVKGEKDISKVISFSKELAKEVNLLRKNPPGYAKHLEEHLSIFQDERLYSRYDGQLIKTYEGKAGI